MLTSTLAPRRLAYWERALVGVIRDLAAAARDPRGKSVASAKEAADVASAVALTVSVPLNAEARVLLVHRRDRVAFRSGSRR